MSEIFTPQNGDDSSDGRPRLVLDTNTVLALWMFRDPKLDALRAWIETGNCLLYSREDALEELRRVLAYRQFGLDVAAQRSIQSDYCSQLSPGSPRKNEDTPADLPLLPACQDPDDQKFLEIAFQESATHLASRDKALTKLARHRLVRDKFTILTPEQLITSIQQHPRAHSSHLN